MLGAAGGREVVNMDREELELYIHIPFCVKKCDYCDFLSMPAPEDVRQAYMEQLMKELAVCGRKYCNYKIKTIFIGGGTPSVLSASWTRRLMEQVYRCFTVEPDAEITMEANPCTLDARKLREYLAAGICRLSIGMQSADDRELKLLGRAHTSIQSEKSYDLAREAGFKNINVDIISAIPSQTVSSYEKTLVKILKMRPEHISAYSLIIEEGTPFFDRYHKAERLREKGRDQYLLPAEETERRMYELTGELLHTHGYMRYEISNYSLPGYECKHNTGYWMRKNYLGTGLGAASLTGSIRFSNTRDLKEYLAKDPECTPERLRYPEYQVLGLREQMEEFMFLGLRMTRGVCARRFTEQFGTKLEDVFGAVISSQTAQGLLEQTGEGYRLTRYGTDVSNYVMAQYLG